MAAMIEQFGIDRMGLDDRIALAEAIWESVEREVEETPLSEAQKVELDRRLGDSLARPDAVTPWEVIYEGALKRARQ